MAITITINLKVIIILTNERKKVKWKKIQLNLDMVVNKISS